jgi:WhiB family redox-sensing transcriptional regulator
MTNNHWSERANCRLIKGIDFFSDDLGAIQRAKKVCERCDVAAECLKQSIKADEIYGVWGGLSQRERRKYHRLFENKMEISQAKEIVVKHGNKVLG